MEIVELGRGLGERGQVVGLHRVFPRRSAYLRQPKLAGKGGTLQTRNYYQVNGSFPRYPALRNLASKIGISQSTLRTN
jgi:hypothetical protein